MCETFIFLRLVFTQKFIQEEGDQRKSKTVAKVGKRQDKQAPASLLKVSPN